VESQKASHEKGCEWGVEKDNHAVRRKIGIPLFGGQSMEK